MSQVIGVDVGGTKIAAGIVEQTHVTHPVEHPTDLSGADAVLDGVVAVVEEVSARGCDGRRPDAVGIGLPSQIEFATGTVLSSVNIPLEGVAVREVLGERLGAPVFVDNDANVAALAEAQLGPDAPTSALVMLTLGTGVGGGIVSGGRIERGQAGLGAELGHIIVDGATALAAPADVGPPRPGSLEWHCSGTALERKANAVARDGGEGALGRKLAADGHVSGRDAVAAAQAGDALALALFEELAGWLGLGIASLVNTFQPQRVTIGGGLSRAADLFLDRAHAVAAANTLPALWTRASLELAHGGSDAGVIGAGMLARQEGGVSLDTPGTHPAEKT